MAPFLVCLALTASALLWRPIHRNDDARRWGAYAGLLLCVPLAVLLGVVAWSVTGVTCSPGQICLLDAQAAPFLAAVAAVPAVLSLLLATGLVAGPRRPLGRVSATLGLTALTALLVLAGTAWLLSLPL